MRKMEWVAFSKELPPPGDPILVFFSELKARRDKYPDDDIPGETILVCKPDNFRNAPELFGCTYWCAIPSLPDV